MAGLLELTNLSRRFGDVTALDNLSFSVPAGQVVGFLGPNGAGKTTTMRAIFGLTDLDGGSVRWDGAPIGPAARRRLGYMPEERGLYPNMLVAEQVTYIGRLHGMDAAAAASATSRWLERLGVADRAASKVEALSHGNQQRVQLAAALVHDPEALVLDEPLAGLVSVIFIFIVLTQYLTWTLMGVMEEKASRVVEVLLATVRPIQLLGGKVIGIGTVALAQAVALAAFALVLAKVVGSSLVHGAAPAVLAAGLAWMILGYAFYSWVYAAAGSLAERQDQVQTLALPLCAPLIFAYIVSLIGASTGSPSLLLKVLAYVPPAAPFAMPTLVGFGAATWWQFVLSVALTLASTVVVAFAAAQVYRTAVLQTGRRVRLRELSRR